MRKGKMVLVAVSFLILGIGGTTFAQSEVRVKYGGPGGQGTVIWFSPSTGVTNMVMSTNGTTFGPILGDVTVAGSLASGGPLTNPRFTAAASTATTIELTSAHYGTMVMINTNAAVAVKLPANGAASGSWIDIAVHSSADDNCAPTISAATADTLITPNSKDSDSVTWGTGHRIGACARFWSDGAFWHVQNLGGTTLTSTDTD